MLNFQKLFIKNFKNKIFHQQRFSTKFQNDSRGRYLICKDHDQYTKILKFLKNKNSFTNDYNEPWLVATFYNKDQTFQNTKSSNFYKIYNNKSERLKLNLPDFIISPSEYQIIKNKNFDSDKFYKISNCGQIYELEKSLTYENCYFKAVTFKDDRHAIIYTSNIESFLVQLLKSSKFSYSNKIKPQNFDYSDISKLINQYSNFGNFQSTFNETTFWSENLNIDYSKFEKCFKPKMKPKISSPKIDSSLQQELNQILASDKSLDTDESITNFEKFDNFDSKDEQYIPEMLKIKNVYDKVNLDADYDESKNLVKFIKEHEEYENFEKLVKSGIISGIDDEIYEKLNIKLHPNQIEFDKSLHFPFENKNIFKEFNQIVEENQSIVDEKF